MFELIPPSNIVSTIQTHSNQILLLLVSLVVSSFDTTRTCVHIVVCYHVILKLLSYLLIRIARNIVRGGRVLSTSHYHTLQTWHILSEKNPNANTGRILSTLGWIVVSGWIFFLASISPMKHLTFLLNWSVVAAVRNAILEYNESLNWRVLAWAGIVVWLVFVKLIGTSELRMKFWKHGVMAATIVGLMLFGWIGPRIFDDTIPKRRDDDDDDEENDALLPTNQQPASSSSSTKATTTLLQRSLHTLSFFPHALLLSLLVTSLSLLLAYWCLTATNYGWTRNVSSFTKSSTLSALSPPLRLHAASLQTESQLQPLLNEFCDLGSCFPLIFKPDECTTDSRGVTVIRSIQEAKRYITERDRLNKERKTMVQTYYEGGTEYVLFYVRYPYSHRGMLKSIGRRNRMIPFERGYEKKQTERHGSYTIEEADELSTPELMQACDAVSYNVTGFHSGRMDVMARDDEALRRGEFVILELNLNCIGDISEKKCCCTSYYKTRDGVSWAYPEQRKWYHADWMIPYRAVRTMAMQIWIGWNNVMKGEVRLKMLLFEGVPAFYEREKRCGLGNHEHYVARP